MSTWRQAAEQVRRKLAGGDPPSDFPVEVPEVYAALAMYLPFVMKREFYQSYQIGEKYLDAGYYATIRDVPVYEKDNRKYSVLPGKPVIIHGRGRPQVQYIGTPDVQITYKEPGEIALVNGSMVGQVFPNARVWYEQITEDCDNTHQLLYQNLPACVSKVDVRYILMPDLDAINPDAPIAISAHLFAELVEVTTNHFGPQAGIPQDTKNDNVNNPGQ